MIGLLIGVPMVDAIVTGAFAVPHGDDWAYLRIVSDFERSGHLTLLNWNQMTLIGQILFGVPFLAVFGNTFTAVHIASVAAAATSLGAAYWLFRRFLSMRLALFGVAAIALDPVFARLSFSYMTDVSALAAQLSCVALGVAALNGPDARRTALLGVALVVGFFGFTIRETAIVAPLAVLCAHALQARQRQTSMRFIAIGGLALVGVSASFYLWREGLPNGGSAYFGQSQNLKEQAEVWVSIYFTLALLGLPAVAMGAHALRSRMSNPLTLAVAAVVLIGGFIRIGIAPSPRVDALLLDGGYLLRSPGGPGGDLGSGPSILGGATAWWVLVAVVLLTGTALAGLAAGHIAAGYRGLRRQRLLALDAAMTTVWIFTALAAGVVLVRALMSSLVYDRYLLPIVPGVLLIVLRWVSANGSGRLPRSAGSAALGLAALFTFVLVAENNAVSVAQWRASQRLVAAGFAPSHVAGGFEWSGFYYPGPINTDQPTRWRPPGPPEGIFGAEPNCAEPSIDHLNQPWMQQIGVLDYHELIGFGTVKLWLYRNAHACTRADPSASTARARFNHAAASPTM